MSQTVRTIGAAIVGGLLVALVAGAWGRSLPVVTMPAADPTTAAVHSISVTGTGTVTLVPDVARLTLGVTVERTTVGSASSDAATAMTAIVAAVKAQGVAAKDIATTGIDLSPRYADCSATGSTSPCPSSGRIVGYTMSEQIAVTVRDLAKVGPVIDRATAAGATNVYGITLTVADPAAAQATARERAIADARAKAEAMAKAAGVSIVGVISIEEGSNSVPVPYAASRLTADAVVTPVEPGSLDVSANVSMGFELP